MTKTMGDKAPCVGPGGVIGILGGGQLGRMLSNAANQLGLSTHIYTDKPGAPASAVSSLSSVAAYDDLNELAAFAETVDVVTYEFENVPAEAVRALDKIGATVFPNVNALETAQDRLLEKSFANDIGVRTAPFKAVATIDDLAVAVNALGAPSILKTRRFGYDGKGQERIPANASTAADAEREAMLTAAWRAIGERPAILEGFVDFAFEISIVAGRGLEGDFAAFEPPRNVHADGILRTSTVPCGADASTVAEAVAATKKIMATLDYVGVMAAEFFVTENGDLLLNEIAPRVHNSGHWTMDACHCCQFEQHIRAICGWPLGTTDRLADVTMINLIGADAEQWLDYARMPNATVHLYGKGDARPGRKMGHVNKLSPWSAKA